VSTGARRAPRARYLPIAEHGLIGDPHTAALVGTDGKIDWYCCPRFDSPSIFGAILDADHRGLFRISPDRDGWSSKQQPVATYGNRFCLFLRFRGPAEELVNGERVEIDPRRLDRWPRSLQPAEEELCGTGRPRLRARATRVRCPHRSEARVHDGLRG
jgi:Trehalase-like, N-terminal